MPTCPVCGAEVDADARFCPQCGAGLTEEGEPDSSAALRDMAEEYASEVREHPDDAAARYSLGLARMHERKWGQAAEQFTRVVEIEPDFADAHANLAVCFAHLGNTREALAAIERAVELGPQKERYRELHGRLADSSS